MKTQRMRLLLPLLMLATPLSACDPGVAEPVQGLAVLVTGPLSDSPLADPESAFVAVVAEAPDIPPDQIQVVQPLVTGQPTNLSLPAVPYGFGRQMRVELYSKDVNGLPTFPVRGRGRTIPQDVGQGETFLVSAYVTKTNAFAPPISEAKQEALTDGRVGAAVVPMLDNGVLIAGGADPAAGATDPFDPKSWTGFKTTVLRYGTKERQLFNLSAAPFNASLSVGRAFLAGAAGFDGTVVLSGGYVDNGAGPEPTNLMEFYDPKSNNIAKSTAGNPVLEFARARHTITRMFDDDNYFMVIGGKGADDKAARTWEIWHPTHGRITAGELSGPRWNHATVRLPEKDGGYMMLVGGENDAGPINNFEVIRYDRFGNVSFKGNTKVTCCVGATCETGADSNAKCASLKGQQGYSEFRWEPLLRELRGGVARTLPAAAYVHNGAPRYNLVYIVGGFQDAKKTQPLNRIDVFDIETGGWIETAPTLEGARGAPVMGWSTAGAQRGQVIVTGGLDASGKTMASGEVLSYDPVGRKLFREWTANQLPAGGTVFGHAVSLSTGKIFIAGGASSDGASLKANTSIRLYNPK